MGQTKLEQGAILQRDELIPRNIYNNDDDSNNYSKSHARALADGDEHGRGSDGYLDVDNYNIGTVEDIYGNPNIIGSGRKPALAQNKAKWGYDPDTNYTTPDMSANVGQITINY